MRFILVSATVPNIDDVASWIGSYDPTRCASARVLSFGEEYRPCPLSRFVYPVSNPKRANDWVFSSILDDKLFPILQQHSSNKPMLVFVPTRKGTMTTAKKLATEYQKAMDARQAVPWMRPSRIEKHFIDKDLAGALVEAIHCTHWGGKKQTSQKPALVCIMLDYRWKTDERLRSSLLQRLSKLSYLLRHWPLVSTYVSGMLFTQH